MAKLLKRLLLVCILLFLVLPVCAYLFIMDTSIQPKLDEVMKPLDEKYKIRVAKDLKWLEKQSIFKSITYKNNAHDYLIKHISLVGSFEQSETKLTNDEKRVQKIFYKFSKEPFRKKIKNIIEDPLFSQIDVSWMNELENFDHWNILSHPFFQNKVQELEKADSIDVLSFRATHPTANSKMLLNFSILKFLKQVGINKNKAYKDFHHTLKLILTEGSLVSHMFVAEGLRYGHLFKKLYPIKEYQHFNLKNYVAFRRVSWAWVGISKKIFYEALDKSFKAYLKPQYGFCAAAYEAPVYTTMPELTQYSYWPFEHNYTKELRRVSNYRKRLLKVCNKDLLARLEFRKPNRISAKMTYATQGLYPKLGVKPNYVPDFDVGSVPYLRRIVWGTLVSVASPSYMNLYRDERYFKDNEKAKIN